MIASERACQCQTQYTYSLRNLQSFDNHLPFFLPYRGRHITTLSSVYFPPPASMEDTVDVRNKLYMHL